MDVCADSGEARQPAPQAQSESLARIEAQLAEAKKKIEQQATELQEVREQAAQLTQVQQKLRASGQLVAQQAAELAQARARSYAFARMEAAPSFVRSDQSASASAVEV